MTWLQDFIDRPAGGSLVPCYPSQNDNRERFSVLTGLRMGKIESLGYSAIRTYDRRCVVIPNRVMASSAIVNRPRGTRARWLPFWSPAGRLRIMTGHDLF